ncbi:hypothetical protein CONPUDRAFT_52497 [Coniophora puteana RWD-64-598 SS2]|uniref:Zn(2)-C6 fungal-type domain-containing protein n=1 Tax=Coniophora puteana (strain RWD-64-598) TaxID=741705 RepID=A0A5M3MXR7_CONPW|nr:uncharacterized protein CONPUDRAFT_52497 [Coniophora puteana RWD-64-598 SS2]EIW83525.1 hypothetical protein CONPUDRAFT_52497 [Coniophora puteana RWD-64-598 SS2]
MATNKTPLAPPPALQRGKACLRCRKRKMRCDGDKPSCQQCVRAKKSDCCQYDDGKGKTRTQLLRENIERLEQRIRELEDPEYTSPSVTLYDPHGHQRSGSSSSSIAGSPGSGDFLPHSPFPSGKIPLSLPHWFSPGGSWIQGVPSPSPTPFSDYLDEPAPELALMLIDIFSSHRHQCLLGIHMGRLRDSYHLPTVERRHPVLMNAIFLWACYLSRPAPLSQHEQHYLAKTLDAMSDALRYPHRILDVIQASCLLAVYYLSCGRALEGSYHATAAASMAVQCGLHGAVTGRSRPLFDLTGMGAGGPFELEPAKDVIEQGERILTFWQVFILDRCWSVVLHKPVTILEGADGLLPIMMPWPQEMEDYEAGHMNEIHNFQGVHSFFDGQLSLSGGFTRLALRAKVSVLYERAHALSANWNQPMGMSTTTPDAIQALDHTITQFVSTLIPVHQLDATMPDDKHAYIAIHTLAAAAMIHLYFPLANDDPNSYDKCLRAARACVNIVKHIADTDFEYLDPIIGPCWTCAADTLIRELNLVEASWQLMDSTEVRNEVGTLLYAMNSLSARFPLLGASSRASMSAWNFRADSPDSSIGYSVAKVQKRLSGL